MSDRPNIIWIVSDQHRAQSLGCMGDENVRTPNLDRLANMGLVFDRAVSSSPICSPARACILTSRYPHENGVPINEHRMRQDVPTIANVFNDHNYHTAWFGKWHVDAPGHDAGPESRVVGCCHCIPRERRGGFETWIGYENLMNPELPSVYGHDETGREFEPQYFDRHDTDVLTDLMVDYLRKRGDECKSGDGRPFFASVSYFAPHDPYIAPLEWAKRFRPGEMKLRPNVPPNREVESRTKVDLSGYCAMIEQIDYNVGRIVETLQQQGLLHNTHIVYFSDHGDMMGSHGLLRKSVPYEEALRVPMIVGGEVSRYSDWNGRGGGRCSEPMSHVDIGPTSLGLCGIDAPESMRGVDLSGWRIPSRERREPESCYSGIWQPMTWDGLDWPWRCVTTRDGWKYATVNGQPFMLFDLNDDPFEMYNLIASQLHKAQRKRLHAMMQEWIDSTGDDYTIIDGSILHQA